MKKFIKVVFVFFIIIALSFAAAYFFYFKKDISSLKKFLKNYGLEKGMKLFEKKETPVTVYLTYGGYLKGILKEETDKEYVLLWKGQEYCIDKRDVKKLVRGTSSSEWKYNNKYVIHLKSGTVLDYKILSIKGNKVSIAEVNSKNPIKMDIEKSSIEYIEFKPVSNDRNLLVENELRKKYPKMEFYSEGNVTIVTDSYINWVKEYKKNIRYIYTQIFLNYYPLFKDRNPSFQNFVVVFDNYIDFVNHAVEEGVPGWAVLGYYNPKTKITYLFNFLGTKSSKVFYDIMIGNMNAVLDSASRNIKNAYGGNEHVEIAVEGAVDEIKDRVWTLYNRILSALRNETLSTLRHEFTHQVLSCWKIQNVEVSTAEKIKKLISKKDEFIKSKDKSKKKEWLKSFLSYGEELNDLKLKASNSWIAEGTATYSEVFPFGGVNNKWLYIFQQMMEKDEVYPISVLNQYKMGSFPNMCSQAVIKAYAESWALTYFLMNNYKKEFMKFMDDIARKDVMDSKEEVLLLEDCIGKSANDLEKEMVDYYKNNFEKLENPSIKFLLYIDELFSMK